MIVAILPAAGHSARMGRPKLILPVDDQTVIARVVNALRTGGVQRVLVVAPPADAAGAGILAREAEAAGAEVVAPDQRPVDMRASFECGLKALSGSAEIPTVLLAPADAIGITPELVAEVIAAARAQPDRIIIPVVETQRGHPVALPRLLADEVRSLPMGVGVNTFIKLHASAIVELPVTAPGALDDLDTPEDYLRWSEPTAE